MEEKQISKICNCHLSFVKIFQHIKLSKYGIDAWYILTDAVI